MKKLSELSKILVVHLDNGTIEGVLNDCIIDLKTLEILGWSYRREGFFSEDGYVWQSDVRFGKEVAFVEKTNKLPNELDQWHSWGKALRKNLIIDHTGKNFGHIRDLLLDADRSSMSAIEIEDGCYIDCCSDVSIRNTVVVVSPNVEIKRLSFPKEGASWWERLLGKDARK